MLGYILHRFAVMIPTLVIISALIFTIIELPPGDYFETYIAELQAQGESVDLRQIAFLRQQYGFDRPPVERYFVWVWGMLHGDFGYSFAYELPVTDVVGDRIWLTILVSFVTIVFTWIIAFPIGIYSATHQYSWGDHGLTFLGLIGLAALFSYIAWAFSPFQIIRHLLPTFALVAVLVGTAVGSTLDDRRQINARDWLVNTQFNLDKFIPERFGWTIPVTVEVKSNTSTPRYDPNQGDVRVQDLMGQHAEPARDALLATVRAEDISITASSTATLRSGALPMQVVTTIFSRRGTWCSPPSDTRSSYSAAPSGSWSSPRRPSAAPAAHGA